MFFLAFTILIFFLSIFGIFSIRNNLILILILIELLLISVNLNFVFFASTLDDVFGELMFLCTLGIAGAEAAIGLAILILYYRLRGLIASENLNFLKG